MSKFLNELCFHLKEDSDKIHVLDKPLIYYSSSLDNYITIPAGFETDLASVPRLPIAYWFWGNKAHREAVLHDYLYRIDSVPVVTFSEANQLFFEAMECRNKSVCVRYPMYWGVCIGGHSSYHKRKVFDKL
jgi:hypothetical protein